MATRKNPKAPQRRRGSVREQREEQILRRFLVQLADSDGTSKVGSKSIDTISREWNLPADDLREFRDGRSESLDNSTVTLLNRLLGRDDGDMLGVDMDDSLGIADPSNGGWYGALLAEESIRQARLSTYQLIDRTRPEAHAALDVWADLAITGNIGEDTRYGGGFEPVIYGAAQTTVDAIKKIEANVNGRLMPDDQKIMSFRGMMKYGDQWGEIGLVDKGGRWDIDRLYPRHARSMYVHREPDGTYNPKYAYKQTVPGRVEPIAKYPEWKIVHFANQVGWGDLYGESIFEPCLRSYIQIESMEAGMIIRRLERASLRYKHSIDVGLIDGGDEALKKYQKEYRTVHRKAKTVDGTKNFRNQKIAMPSEEDFYLFKRDKDSPADIETIEGDVSIGEITDFLHFWKKWMSGLGPPSSHIGYEDNGSGTGVNDKHVVFARKVRRGQIKYIAGLNHLYWVSLILRGIDPRTVRFSIFPPAMGTRDELLRAQIQLAKATTCQYLAAAFGSTGKQPSTGWFLKYLMGMDDEVTNVDALQLTPVIQKGTPGFKNAPPKHVKNAKEDRQMADMALKQPKVIEQVDHLNFLLSERAISLKLPEVGERMARLTKPVWHDRFDDVVRSMGIRELRSAA